MHQNTDGIWSFDDKGKATKRLAQRDGESLMILKCIQLTEDQTEGKDTAQQVSSKQVAEGGFIKDPWESHDSV